MTPPASRSDRCDISLVVNTHQRPRHLALVLESIAAQEGVAGRFDVVVSDDGSTDDTAAVVAAFATRVPFPVRFTTSPRDGFRLARVRNRGAALAGGDSLLFLDGDCILPPDHVAAYLERRRPGRALLGYCARLPETASHDLLPGAVDWGVVQRRIPAAERQALARRCRKARWHTWLRHPDKPRLAGGNFLVWRDDFRAVNGFDERFRGWGQEDDDLGLRLRAAGVRLETILDRTFSCHVWHPTDPTAGSRWCDGPNVAYFLRRGRLTTCRHGLVERPAGAIRWGLPPDLEATPVGRAVATALAGAPCADEDQPCEIEIMVETVASALRRARFRRRAECRLLLVPAAAPSAEQAAHEQAAQHRGSQKKATPRGSHRLRRQADRIVPVDPEGVAAVLADIG
ncbi:MAG: glycosyltransferase [Planctomycetia bacterium]|nr:glycosyltransferase [Planctomycetia bacterium]